MTLPTRIFWSRRTFDVAVILFFAVVISLPIYFFGIPRGNDLPQHYQFATAYREAIANGNPSIGWSAATNYGFGDVGVRFYPPLAYWTLASAELVWGNWYDASVMTFAFWFFISGLGVYCWCREWFSENGSLFGAILYMLTPYHVNELYNAFTYAEFAAAAILPFCFWFATRVSSRGNWNSVVGLGVSYALLLITHIPMAVLGSLGLFVYLAVSVDRRVIFATALRSGAALLLGLAASSFYWLRVAIELPFVKHSTAEYSSGMYDFHVNFLASVFYLAAIDYDSRSLWFADLMLAITLGLFLPGLALVFVRAKKSLSKLRGVLGLLIFALVIATPISLPLWENAKVLQMIQFPWRAMALVSLCASVLAVEGFEQVVRSLHSRLRPVGLLAAGLVFACIVFTGAQIVRPAVHIDRESFLHQVSALSTAESYECWWPVWAEKQAFEKREIASTPDRDVFAITTSQNGIVSVRLSDGPDSIIRVPVFYYPHWTALFGSEKAVVTPDENGAILIHVPHDQSEIDLFFQEPFYVTAANIISFAAWIIFLMIAVFYLRKSLSPEELLK